MAAASPNLLFAKTARRWNTPRLLLAALAGVWLSALLFFLAAVIGMNQRQQALQIVSQNLAPKIIAAQRIKAGLSDMDATAADVLLLPHNEQQEQCDDRYEMRRVEVTEALRSVAQIGSRANEAEDKALRDLSNALGTYENDVAVARLLHLRNQLGSRLVFRVTHSEMHDTLLPSADAFSKAVRDSLDASYKRQETLSRVMGLAAWGVGLLTLAALIATQIFLSRRTRRTLNLALLGATALALVLLLYTQRLFSQEEAALQTVKASFASVSNLWQARALAFDADAEESRWLMDTPQAPQYEQAYLAQSALLMAPPPASGQPSPAGADPGILAMAETNAASNGAKAKAQEMLSKYSAFAATDRELRDMEQHNHHSDAVNFCIGRRPGQHDRAFLDFDAALDAMLTEEKSAFDAAAAEGLAHLAGFNALAGILLLAILALSGIGLRARLQEYA